MKRILYILLTLILMAGSFYLGRISGTTITLFEEGETLETHTIVLEKIESLGKMELVKYEFQDIVSHKKEYDWFPDPQVLLLINGESVGCIDFSQMDQSSIQNLGDSALVLQVPAPEICYTRIDHEKSRVYHTQYTFFEEANLVDAAYEAAEKEIDLSAQRADIIEKTKQQAVSTLVPMFEAISGKKIIFEFPIQTRSTILFPE